MRKITEEAIEAFNLNKNFKRGNTEVKVEWRQHTQFTTLLLHGNPIAESCDKQLAINNCGYETNTTKERLNGLQGVSINQKNYEWFLNGEPMEANTWIKIN
jgi:hypothetical protein